MEIKKTLFLILIMIAFFTLNAITTKAGFFEISHECQEENCISGQDINWSISFENKGQKEIKIVGIELIDSINQSQIASFIFEYDSSKSDKLNYLKVLPGKKETAYIKAKIPKPNLKNQLIYMPCITTAMPTTAAKYVGSYTDRVCYPNESITVFECIIDNHCEINELCKNEKCKQIICKDCQYIFNKKCIDYECCVSETCNLDESCINHKCVALNCSQDEKILNHSCVKLECGYDEYVSNHKCVKLNCSYDEQAVNHVCVKLNCSYDEYIVSHNCVKLECGDYEGYLNHSCVKLECDYDEHIVNHGCVKLECGFFEKIAVNKCAADKEVIYKFAIELIITISIIYVLILDIKKYKSKHKKE